MQTAHIIRYLRRIAAAHSEELLHPLTLDSIVIMCPDSNQSDVIRRLFDAWTKDYECSSNDWEKDATP